MLHHALVTSSSTDRISARSEPHRSQFWTSKTALLPQVAQKSGSEASRSISLNQSDPLSRFGAKFGTKRGVRWDYSRQTVSKTSPPSQIVFYCIWTQKIVFYCPQITTKIVFYWPTIVFYYSKIVFYYLKIVFNFKQIVFYWHLVFDVCFKIISISERIVFYYLKIVFFITPRLFLITSRLFFITPRLFFIDSNIVL